MTEKTERGSPRGAPRRDALRRLRAELRRRRRNELALIENLRKQRKKLEALLENTNGHWVVEDIVYRLYHTPSRHSGPGTLPPIS